MSYTPVDYVKKFQNIIKEVTQARRVAGNKVKIAKTQCRPKPCKHYTTTDPESEANSSLMVLFILLCT